MIEYKKKTDEIHAPESLITATLDRIHEEEKMQSNANCNNEAVVPKTAKIYKWGRAAFATVAAAIVLVIGLSGNNSQLNLVYNTVPESIVRTVTGEQAENNMTVEDYSAYLGIDIQKPTENANMIKSEINVAYDGETVVEDEGTVYYNVDGEQMMIRFSRTVDTAPDNLAIGKTSEVNGQTILVAVSENGTERMATFKRNGISCFLLSYSMEQQEFEAFLVSFLESIEK